MIKYSQTYQVQVKSEEKIPYSNTSFIAGKRSVALFRLSRHSRLARTYTVCVLEIPGIDDNCFND